MKKVGSELFKTIMQQVKHEKADGELRVGDLLRVAKQLDGENAYESLKRITRSFEQWREEGENKGSDQEKQFAAAVRKWERFEKADIATRAAVMRSEGKSLPFLRALVSTVKMLADTDRYRENVSAAERDRQDACIRAKEEELLAKSSGLDSKASIIWLEEAREWTKSEAVREKIKEVELRQQYADCELNTKATAAAWLKEARACKKSEELSEKVAVVELLNEALEKYEKKCESVESSAKGGKYDRQYIIDLGSGRSAQGLVEKAQKKDLETRVFRFPKLDVLDAQKHKQELLRLFLRGITGGSRLYIVGHCNEGLKSICSDCVGFLKHTCEVGDIAEALADELKERERGLKISLVACYGGKEGEVGESFAESLCRQLHEKKINSEVRGFLLPVKRRGNLAKSFHKVAVGCDKPNEPGTRVAFSVENGRVVSKKLHEESEE